MQVKGDDMLPVREGFKSSPPVRGRAWRSVTGDTDDCPPQPWGGICCCVLFALAPWLLWLTVWATSR